MECRCFNGQDFSLQVFLLTDASLNESWDKHLILDIIVCSALLESWTNIIIYSIIDCLQQCAELILIAFTRIQNL
jgi:hypothetical protein